MATVTLVPKTDREPVNPEPLNPTLNEVPNVKELSQLETDNNSHNPSDSGMFIAPLFEPTPWPSAPVTSICEVVSSSIATEPVEKEPIEPESGKETQEEPSSSKQEDENPGNEPPGPNPEPPVSLESTNTDNKKTEEGPAVAPETTATATEATKEETQPPAPNPAPTGGENTQESPAVVPESSNSGSEPTQGETPAPAPEAASSPSTAPVVATRTWLNVLTLGYCGQSTAVPTPGPANAEKGSVEANKEGTATAEPTKAEGGSLETGKESTEGAAKTEPPKAADANLETKTDAPVVASESAKPVEGSPSEAKEASTETGKENVVAPTQTPAAESSGVSNNSTTAPASYLGSALYYATLGPVRTYLWSGSAQTTPAAVEATKPQENSVANAENPENRVDAPVALSDVKVGEPTTESAVSQPENSQNNPEGESKAQTTTVEGSVEVSQTTSASNGTAEEVTATVTPVASLDQ